MAAQHQFEFEYDALVDQESSKLLRSTLLGTDEDPNFSQAELSKCKLPRRRSWLEWKFARYGVQIVVAVGLLLGIFCLGVIAAMIVRSVTTNDTGFEPSNSDYALYKNSRFEECYNGFPGSRNCTHSQVGPSRANDRDHAFQGLGYVRDTQDWCQVVSCFHGFKIVPSTARISATNLPDIACWLAILLTSTTALWHTGRRLTNLAHNNSPPCKRSRDISWVDWILLAYDICGQFLWWWVSFIIFATDPTKSAAIAATSWVTTWKLGRLVQYHPYYCALPASRRTRRAIPYVLNAMAILQWIAGIYVLYVYRGDLVSKVSALKGYDCLASRILDAPGTTPCTPEELCSNGALFRNSDFLYDKTLPLNGRFTLFFYFLLWTLVAIVPFIMVFIARCDTFVGSCCGIPQRTEKDKKEDWKTFDLAPETLISLSSLTCIIWGTIYSAWLLKTWNGHGREGPIAFDTRCNALHVYLSPWRHYLDVSDYARAFRVAKMWFNA
jgi:hypothetical protein